MINVPFFDYYDMKEFYSLREVCQLFNCGKPDLKEACERFDVKPRQNEIGEFGLTRYDVRKLHNALYHENKHRIQEADPWA